MWIEIGSAYVTVVISTERERAWLGRYLTFRDSSFMGRGRPIELYEEHRRRFPAGLLGLVQAAAGRDQIDGQPVKLEILDKRPPGPPRDVAADLAWLRDYQLEAVEAVLAKERGIVQLATGGGKSEIAVALARAVPARWLFVVHRANLVDQTAERYRQRTQFEPRDLGSSMRQPLGVGLSLCTFQSLVACLRREPTTAAARLSEVDGIVVDECHVQAADTFYAVTMRASNARYRVGLSGTPLDRTDKRSLMAVAALGTVIYKLKAKDLVEAGVLAAPKVTMVTVRQRSQLMQPAKHSAMYEELIVSSDKRNRRVVDEVQHAAKPCMVFVKNLEHGMRLETMLGRAGITCEFVHGQTSRQGRAEAVKRLERRDVDVLVASVVFQEGVDVPSLASVVVASAGKSVIATLQRVGRGMRTDGGRKASFHVIDVMDVGQAWAERHARRRADAYVREGFETVVVGEDGTSCSSHKVRGLKDDQ